MEGCGAAHAAVCLCAAVIFVCRTFMFVLVFTISKTTWDTFVGQLAVITDQNGIKGPIT